VKKFLTPALTAKTPLLGVAKTRRSPSYGCVLRLDQERFGSPFGRAESIHSL